MHRLHAVAQGVMRSFHLSDQKLREPELVCGPERPMTGFLATLSSDQKREALAYDGPENHGDLDFKR